MWSVLYALNKSHIECLSDEICSRCPETSWLQIVDVADALFVPCGYWHPLLHLGVLSLCWGRRWILWPFMGHLVQLEVWTRHLSSRGHWRSILMFLRPLRGLVVGRAHYLSHAGPESLFVPVLSEQRVG